MQNEPPERFEYGRRPPARQQELRSRSPAFAPVRTRRHSLSVAITERGLFLSCPRRHRSSPRGTRRQKARFGVQRRGALHGDPWSRRAPRGYSQSATDSPANPREHRKIPNPRNQSGPPCKRSMRQPRRGEDSSTESCVTVEAASDGGEKATLSIEISRKALGGRARKSPLGGRSKLHTLAAAVVKHQAHGRLLQHRRRCWRPGMAPGGSSTESPRPLRGPSRWPRGFRFLHQTAPDALRPSCTSRRRSATQEGRIDRKAPLRRRRQPAVDRPPAPQAQARSSDSRNSEAAAPPLPAGGARGATRCRRHHRARPLPPSGPPNRSSPRGTRRQKARFPVQP